MEVALTSEVIPRLQKRASMSSANNVRETTPPDIVPPPPPAVSVMATVIEEEADGAKGDSGDLFSRDGSLELEEAAAAEEDELDLFPGGLELPPLRSPRGSLHSLYGSNCSSRKNSNCSVGSNARWRRSEELLDLCLSLLSAS